MVGVWQWGGQIYTASQPIDHPEPDALPVSQMVILILFPPTSMCFTLKSTPVVGRVRACVRACGCGEEWMRGRHFTAWERHTIRHIYLTLTNGALLMLIKVVVREAQQYAASVVRVVWFVTGGTPVKNAHASEMF